MIIIYSDLHPVFHQTFPEQTHKEGPAVSLKCVASGNPPPILSWLVVNIFLFSFIVCLRYLDDQLLRINQETDFMNKRENGFMDRLVIGKYLEIEGR